LRLEQPQGFALGTVVQAIVADLAEAGGQNVLQKAPDELLRHKASRAGSTGIAIAVAEHDGRLIVFEDGGVGQSDAEDVTRQVFERMLTGTHGFGVHDPRFAPDTGRDRGGGIGSALW
jgi:RNA 3'-terminal phosphate cyclase